MTARTEAALPGMNGGSPEREAPAAGSVLGRLRARRDDLAADHRLDLDIPGYDGDLVARYRPLTAGEQTRLAGKVERAERIAGNENQEGEAQLRTAMDTIIAACVEILARQDGQLVPLAAIIGSNVPVRYDEQLAEALGITDAGSARAVLRGVFPRDKAGDVLPQPVSRHANEVALWMTRIGSDADGDLLGEA